MAQNPMTTNDTGAVIDFLQFSRKVYVIAPGISKELLIILKHEAYRSLLWSALQK